MAGTDVVQGSLPRTDEGEGAVTIVLVLLQRDQHESLVNCPEEVALVG
jgi:hypothetical protein